MIENYNNYPKPKLISFRDEISDISKTTYLTHSLYYHPAKFIPQTVRFCLDNYCPRNGNVLDPFAGSGTTGVEASINGYKSFLTDINPLLNIFYEVKMNNLSEDQWGRELKKVKKILLEVLYNKNDDPKLINENIEYWYPPKLLSFFTNTWSNYHQLSLSKNNIANNVLVLTLFKVSKKFSFAEHSMPKLFISKRKRAFIEELLEEDNLNEKIEKFALRVLNDMNKSILSMINYKNTPLKSEYYVGVDASEFDYSKLPEIDCIITSPPYMQAQEYIRSFQLEMMWFGISQDKIKELKSKEIPFRKAPTKIEGQYINAIRSQISSKSLVSMYDSYFWFTCKALEGSTVKLKKGGKICILVGNPKMQGIKVEIWKVILDYFVNDLNFKLIEVFEDRIKSRKLFKKRNNLNPSGMKSEYMVILEK